MGGGLLEVLFCSRNNIGCIFLGVKLIGDGGKVVGASKVILSIFRLILLTTVYVFTIQSSDSRKKRIT